MSLPLLLPYQQRWLADGSKIRLWEKSRRIGASWTVACESVIEASRAVGGSDTWYIAYSKEATQEFIRDCTAWAQAFNAAAAEVEEVLIANEGKDVLTYRITFASGKRITALSSRPTGLRNKRDRIVIDEAAHHEDLDELIKAAVPVIMWGGRVDILSTHNGVGSPFNRICNEVKAKRLGYSHHRTTIDDAIADGLVQRICTVTGAEWSPANQGAWRADLFNLYGDHAKEELLCVPLLSGGTYLSRPVVESCMYQAPVFRFEAEPGFATLPDESRASAIEQWLDENVAGALRRLSPDRFHAFGEDFGRTIDITVIVPIALNANLSRTIPFILELRDTPYREQELALFYVVDRLPRFFKGALDATGNGQYLAERAWQRYGETRIERVTLNDKWYGAQLPKLKADFEDQMIACPKDADTLSDLQAFKMIDGIPKLPSTKRKQKAASKMKSATRHGDSGVGIAIARYASDAPIGDYNYQSVPGPRAREGLS